MERGETPTADHDGASGAASENCKDSKFTAAHLQLVLNLAQDLPMDVVTKACEEEQSMRDDVAKDPLKAVSLSELSTF